MWGYTGHCVAYYYIVVTRHGDGRATEYDVGLVRWGGGVGSDNEKKQLGRPGLWAFEVKARKHRSRVVCPDWPPEYGRSGRRS